MSLPSYDFPFIIYLRTYDSGIEKFFPSYPYRWVKVDKVFPKQEYFKSIKTLKLWIKDITEGLPDGVYTVHGYARQLKLNRRKAYHNHARYRRVFVGVMSFEKKGNLIRLKNKTSNRQQNKGNMIPGWKRLISEYKRMKTIEDNKRMFSDY